MKLLNVLMALYFSFLSVLPVEAEHSKFALALYNIEDTVSCCHQDVDKEKPNQTKKCCDNSVCNPFNNCGCSTFLQLSVSDLECYSFEFERQAIPIYTNKDLSNFTDECFHPPNFLI